MSLPEAISSRYLETKKRMIALKDDSEAEIESNRIEKLRKEGRIDDDVFPPDDPAMGKPVPGQLAIADQSGAKPPMLSVEDEMPRPPSGNPPMTTGMALFDEEAALGERVKRVQLQRMLDEDEILREICDTDKAIDIMRRFQVDTADIDPYEAVAQLQHKVAHMIHELENSGHTLTFDELETLKVVSGELHGALTESQREWRQELLSVMQMASLLSKALVELTRKMELVQLNHNTLTSMIQPR
jgi:hypothetical protein